MAMKSTGGEAFVMSARLAEISESVTDLPLSRVMLANDARFPWLMLIPRRAILNPIRRRSANASCLSSGLAWASWGYRWGSVVDAMKRENPSIDFELGFRRRSIAVPCVPVHRSQILKLSKSTETTVEARQQGIKLLSRTIIF